MELLTRDFHLLSMDEAASLLRAEETLPSRAIAVTIDDGYEDAYTHAYPILREFGVPAAVFLPTGFIGTDLAPGKRPPWAQGSFLSWAQVREMHRGGIDFGSHAVDHPSLPSLPPQQIRDQLEQSKRRIEDETGAPVRGLSYPYGLPEDVHGMEPFAAAAGYSWAVTGIHGLNAGSGGLFALRRIKVERDDGLYVFAKAAVGAMDAWVVVDRLGAIGRRTRH
jgi:peptidoglycan/xylan/chitin deacetylase (PgdA/CDA1 family)